MRFYRSWLVFCTLLLLGMGVGARAHQPGETYLNLVVETNRLAGQWDIALRDLSIVIELDGNNDGQVTYEELQKAQSKIAAYAMARLELKVDGTNVAPQVTEHEVSQHQDGIYAVINFEITNLYAPSELEMTYRLFFDFNHSHRGLLNLVRGDTNQVAVFSPEQSTQRFDLVAPTLGKQFLQFAGEGLWHIWAGFDHVLFLAALLLPVVLRREGDRWRVVESFGPAFVAVLKVITGFTMAHALTLTLATSKLVTVPSRAAEPAIALTVILAAVNNVKPFFRGSGWVVAFVFGLVHGFGFASSMEALHLDGGILALALVAFNVGVETGQLVIAMLFLPLAFVTRETWWYQNLTFKMGSICVALIATTWFVQRVWDLPLLPF